MSSRGEGLGKPRIEPPLILTYFRNQLNNQTLSTDLHASADVLEEVPNTLPPNPFIVNLGEE
jgi:hypothetical protein